MRASAQARRPHAYGAAVQIVQLADGQEPPRGERFLMFQWARAGSGCAVHRPPSGLRYVVGPDKHAFWMTEAVHLARRLNFERIYYRGSPDPERDLGRRESAPNPS